METPPHHLTTCSISDQVTEALLELVRGHQRRLSQPGDADRIVEVALVQADHVAAGALVALAVDVHAPLDVVDAFLPRDDIARARS